MTIDPGVTGTGIAIWNSYKGIPCNKIPIFTNSIIIRGKESWRKKIEDYTQVICSYMNLYSPCNHIYIEEPIFMESAKGLASARSDSLEKLISCASYFAGYFSAVNRKVEFVRIIDWKGTMPKDVTERRIRKVIENDNICEGIHNHAWDAVGIGLYLQKLL